MKKTNLGKMITIIAVAGLVLSASNALAQNITGPNTAQPAVVNVNVAQLPDGVPQIVQLAQAKVADDTIIAYIKNSGNSYVLDASQILYLRQQGVSDAVITTMLSQPRPAVAMTPPPTPAPQPVASTVMAQPVPPATVAPTVTYVQTVPAPVYYYQPYYYPAYAPAYSTFPVLSLSFAWGSGGGGWHGGGNGGGWHGGGGHH